jgi:hypothetical protein
LSLLPETRVGRVVSVNELSTSLITRKLTSAAGEVWQHS